MTNQTPDRARVEAWMWERCPHDGRFLLKRECSNCLLAFAAAQWEQGLRSGRKRRMVVIHTDLATDASPIWFAECPELPGCQSHGLTEAAARAHIDDAITEYLIEQHRARREGPG